MFVDHEFRTSACEVRMIAVVQIPTFDHIAVIPITRHRWDPEK